MFIKVSKSLSWFERVRFIDDYLFNLRFRAQMSTNLKTLLTDTASKNKKWWKRNFHSEISAIHCWSFSFKWTGGPKLVNSATCVSVVNNLTNGKRHSVYYWVLYNNPSYSRILIGSCLWSIRGQMHDWRQSFSLCRFKMAESFENSGIIFYVTGQKIRYKKVLPRHWTGSRSPKTKAKAVSFRK